MVTFTGTGRVFQRGNQYLYLPMLRLISSFPQAPASGAFNFEITRLAVTLYYG